jgi:tetratricopeptide (TPR) repeat protein
MTAADGYVKARAAAKKAIELDKYEPRAYKVLAYVHLFYDWDWNASIAEYNKAIKYGLPEQNEFITYYDIFIEQNYLHAINVAKKIVESDPLNVDSHWQLGICNYFAGRFEEALVSINNALELDPSFSDGHQWRGAVLGYLGRYDEAISSLEKALELTKGEGLAIYDLLAVKIQMGKKDEALQQIKSMEYVDPMDIARLYTMLEMPDEAIAMLEKGYRERSVMMITLKDSWIWDPLRNDPRFIEIYKRMNFPE